MEDTVSLLALVTASLALISSIIFSILQKIHNKVSARNSVRPYADFSYCCAYTQISVHLKNAGIGTMIVRSLTVRKNGKEVNSIKSSFNENDNDFLHMVATIIGILRSIEIETVYEDVYETKFSKKRELSKHFGEQFIKQYEGRIAAQLDGVKRLQ